MVATGNGRMKRKNVTNEVKAEPEKKCLKKSDLLLEYNALQQKFDALQAKYNILDEENATHMDALEMLEETVKLLESKLPNVEQKSSSVQTETSRNQNSTAMQTESLELKDCEFPTKHVNNLAEPIQGSNLIQNVQHSIKCYYCEQRFETKRELMEHRNKDHEEKAQFCSYFSEGKCDFDESCWYSHDQPTVIPEIKCNICGQIFQGKSSFMKHRKKYHIKNVPKCRSLQNGTCQYGSENCWFKHNDLLINDEINEVHEQMDIVENDEKSEMMQKLFEMVEKYTERIILLENEIKESNHKK